MVIKLNKITLISIPICLEPGLVGRAKTQALVDCFYKLGLVPFPVTPFALRMTIEQVTLVYARPSAVTVPAEDSEGDLDN